MERPMPEFRQRKSALLRRRPLHGIATHAEFIVKMRNQLDSWQEWSGIPSLAVGDPNILYLIGMLKVPAAFSLPAAEEVQLAAFVGPDLLQVSDGECLRGHTHLRVAITPNCIQVIVLRHDL